MTFTARKYLGGKLGENKFCLEIVGEQVYGISENLLLRFLAIRLKKKEPTSTAHPRGTTVLPITVRTAELRKTTTAL